MFPALAQSTGELPMPTVDEPSRYRDSMMPRRRQTREQTAATASTPNAERTELIAEEERQRQAWLAANYEPPPF